ncbi:23069_t:CDS:2 [Cetraspora pellucida]|uniref:23069_t:CDS:1 n=1 Tax=Cetraspora pellucida TaxID=1433469 RepID=A0A9N9ND22_9GLOM|nr:23069_t:CDS:2 [Cetraspora pellucida]
METINTKQDDNDNSQDGALVLWKYNNPFSNYKRDPERIFVFNGFTLKISQKLSDPIDITQNTGNIVWDGAYILSKYIVDHLNLDYLVDTNRRRKIRFLELGSGCGLVGLVAWLTGGYVVCTGIFNDIEHTKFNIKQNAEYVMNQQQDQLEYDGGKDDVVEDRSKNVHTKKMLQNLDLLNKDDIQVHVLDWTSLPTAEDTTNPLHKSNIQPFDIILASEILYLPDLHKDLVKTICYFSHSKPINDQETSSKKEMKCETRVLGIYKQRGLGEEQFFNIARIFGKFRVEWIDTNWIYQPSIESHVNQLQSTISSTYSEYKMFWVIPDS